MIHKKTIGGLIKGWISHDPPFCLVLVIDPQKCPEPVTQDYCSLHSRALSESGGARMVRWPVVSPMIHLGYVTFVGGIEVFCEKNPLTLMVLYHHDLNQEYQQRNDQLFYGEGETPVSGKKRTGIWVQHLREILNN